MGSYIVDTAILFNDNQNAKSRVTSPGKYSTTGAVLLGPKAMIRQPDELALRLETLEGAHVHSVSLLAASVLAPPELTKSNFLFSL